MERRVALAAVNDPALPVEEREAALTWLPLHTAWQVLRSWKQQDLGPVRLLGSLVHRISVQTLLDQNEKNVLVGVADCEETCAAVLSNTEGQPWTTDLVDHILWTWGTSVLNFTPVKHLHRSTTVVEHVCKDSGIIAGEALVSGGHWVEDPLRHWLERWPQKMSGGEGHGGKVDEMALVVEVHNLLQAASQLAKDPETLVELAELAANAPNDNVVKLASHWENDGEALLYVLKTVT